MVIKMVTLLTPTASRPSPGFTSCLLHWNHSFVLHDSVSSLRVCPWKGLQNWIWLNLCEAFNFQGSTHLSAFCTLMYYYDTAYCFMVTFIFAYNYLHEFDEMAAVCSSVFFSKAMFQTCFSCRATAFRVCRWATAFRVCR